MTIQEAINHAKDVAERNRKQYKNCPADRRDIEHQTCEICAEQHGQLAEWLKEFQQYREIGTIEECALFKGISEKDLPTSCLDLKMIKELHEYKKIGTVEECQEARGKQKEKKYKKIQPCKSVNYYQCPCCNGLLHMNENFCGDCGQAISWEDEECLT